MSVLAFHKEERWKVGIWYIEESIDELLEMLPSERNYREQIELFTSAVRRREWLAARVLLQEMCGEHKEVAYTESHNPYLTDGSYHISISHTKGYVAVMLSRDYEVGVDIEFISNRVKNIRHRFLSYEENKIIRPERELQQLLVCWCTKETLFKLLDKVGVRFSYDLKIHPFVLEHRGSLQAQELLTPEKHLYTVSYVVTKHYVITCALQ